MARRTVRRYELREIEEDLDAPVGEVDGVDFLLTANGRSRLAAARDAALADVTHWRERVEAIGRERDAAIQRAADWEGRALRAEAALAEHGLTPALPCPCPKCRAIAPDAVCADELRRLDSLIDGMASVVSERARDADQRLTALEVEARVALDRHNNVIEVQLRERDERIAALEATHVAKAMGHFENIWRRLDALEGDDGAVTKGDCDVIDYVAEMDKAARRDLGSVIDGVTRRVHLLEMTVGVGDNAVDREWAQRAIMAAAPHGEGDAFLPNLGTLRTCGGCGCVVSGGPTTCVQCASGTTLQHLNERITKVEVAGDPVRWLSEALDIAAKRKAERG